MNCFIDNNLAIPDPSGKNRHKATQRRGIFHILDILTACEKQLCAGLIVVMFVVDPFKQNKACEHKCRATHGQADLLFFLSGCSNTSMRRNCKISNAVRSFPPSPFPKRLFSHMLDCLSKELIFNFRMALTNCTFVLEKVFSHAKILSHSFQQFSDICKVNV